MTPRATAKVLATSAALFLGLTACTGGPVTSGQSSQGASSSSSAAGGGSPAGGNIRYLVEQPEDPATLKLIAAHVKDFEKKNPTVKVKLEAMPSENMRTVLQTQLRSGEGPDVFSWGSGPGYAGALAKAGLVYDLTGAYDKYKWNVYDFAKQQVTFDGKIVGVPGEMETIGLFYNKDLFTKNGLKQPQNLAELTTAMQKFKEQKITPLAAADQEGWPGGHMLSMALSSRLGSQGMADLISGKTPWTSPDVVAALDVWKGWNEAKLLPDFPTSLTTDGAAALFYSQKAAILPTGSWAIEAIEKNSKFNVGYMPFPAEAGPGVFTGGLGSGPFISANTKNVDAATTFVDFLASPEHGRWTVENLQTIPSYPVDTKGIKVSPLFAQVLKDTSKFSTGGDFGVNIDVLQTDRFNKAMWDGVQGVLSGQTDSQKVAERLQAAAKK